MISPNDNSVQSDPVAQRVMSVFPNAVRHQQDLESGLLYPAYWTTECPTGQAGHHITVEMSGGGELTVYCDGVEKRAVWNAEYEQNDTVQVRCSEAAYLRAQLPHPSLAEHLYVRQLQRSARPGSGFIIPQLLAPQDRLILTGEEGHGKTTFNRQFALQTACGIHPLTLERMEPRRVLYIDREVGPEYTFDAFESMVERSGVDMPGAAYLDIWTEVDTLDFNSTTVVDALMERVQDVDLLAIGPLHKLTHADLSDEHAAKAVTNVLDQIRSGGTAMIIEAPQPKAGMKGRSKQPYGSSMFLRWPEFGLHLNKGGKLTHWRDSRLPEREWPEKLTRDGKEWPWMVAADDRTPWEKLGIHKATYYRRLASQVDDAAE